MAKHNELGKWGEDFAAEYLKEQGYVIRDRDWHCGKRDIDLVAISADLTTIVFVEVKTRTSDEVSEPADAVNKQKIRNLGIAANNYIKQFNVVEQVRFDVVTIVGSNQQNAKLEHIEDAFNPLLV